MDVTGRVNRVVIGGAGAKAIAAVLGKQPSARAGAMPARANASSRFAFVHSWLRQDALARERKAFASARKVRLRSDDRHLRFMRLAVCAARKRLALATRTVDGSGINDGRAGAVQTI